MYSAVVHNNSDCRLPTVTNGRGLKDYILNPNRQPLWLCADEVQQTYGDKKLWDALFDVAHRTLDTFIIAAGSFGLRQSFSPLNDSPKISHDSFPPNE